MAVSEQDAVELLGAVSKGTRKPKPVKPRPYVLCDTREQRVLRFKPDLDVDCGSATLPAGDYSIRYFSALIALERKSTSDLISTLSQGRERFERELDILAGYRWKAILVEGNQRDVEAGNYRSQMTVKSVVGSLRAIWARWDVPTFWCGDPAGCADYVAWMAHRLHDKHWDLADFGEKEQANGTD